MNGPGQTLKCPEFPEGRHSHVVYGERIPSSCRRCSYVLFRKLGFQQVHLSSTVVILDSMMSLSGPIEKLRPHLQGNAAANPLTTAHELAAAPYLASFASLICGWRVEV